MPVTVDGGQVVGLVSEQSPKGDVFEQQPGFVDRCEIWGKKEDGS